MLQEIVNIYKIDSTNYNLEAKNINLRDLIEETLNFYAPLITKYQKEISYSALLKEISFALYFS